MKKYLIPSVLMIVGLSLIIGGAISNKVPSHTHQVRHIIKQVYFVEQTEDDAKEFISVVFTEGKDTFALDYLTLNEYDSCFPVVPVQYYKSGDILYPSYACPDTLIVTDGKGLSKGMAFIEQGIIDGTDGDIDSILHQYAAPYTVNGGLQPKNFASR